MNRTTILAKMSALATEGGFDGRHGGHHRGGGLLILVLLVVATALIAWFIARRRSGGSRRPTASAETIVAERLARSEISVDDYRTTLAALRET